MDDTNKMLRLIINGQSLIKSDILLEIKKLSKRMDSLEDKMSLGFKNIKSEILENRKRLDKFGYRLAEIEDDAPTHREFEDLMSRVKKLEQKMALA